jgi:hypothetical protein
MNSTVLIGAYDFSTAGGLHASFVERKTSCIKSALLLKHGFSLAEILVAKIAEYGVLKIPIPNRMIIIFLKSGSMVWCPSTGNNWPYFLQRNSNSPV